MYIHNYSHVAAAVDTGVLFKLGLVIAVEINKPSTQLLRLNLAHVYNIWTEISWCTITDVHHVHICNFRKGKSHDIVEVFC